MNGDKKRLTMLIGSCFVVLLVMSVAGCTAPNSVTSPTPTPTVTTSTAQGATKAQPQTQSQATALPTSPPANVQSYTGPFVGSKNSDVYHYPWCSEAKKIKPENFITFNTVADGCAANYRPCKVCNPPACGVTPLPSVIPTPSPTPTPTPSPTKIATSIHTYVPPVWYAYGLLPTPYAQSVKQGQMAVVAVVINGADGKHPCGPPVSYYIDHQAAGGDWQIPQSSSFGPYGCAGGATPHMELQLSGTDTAKLSIGTHTFQISYPGDDKYAPAEYATQFSVTRK
ncbi:MAG: Ada metal-binding domain-containing protein [Halobacteriota archaeon]